MSIFSPASQAAIARLRSYVPPSTIWYSMPVSRRAGVLILLFADKKGDLRVVLTMRSSTLSSFAGQAALPGGKADTVVETPLQTARREASEEIGLPEPDYDASHPLTTLDRTGSITHTAPTATPSSFPASTSNDDSSKETDPKSSPPTYNLPHPFRIDHLCQMPAHLAKTELAVRPVVALLYATSPFDSAGAPVDAESMLIPRLDAKEVAAVFSAPMHNFLRSDDELPGDMEKPPGQWYHGAWTAWHEKEQFRMHNFYVPVQGQVVTRPKKKGIIASSGSEEAQKAAEQGAMGTDNPAAATGNAKTARPPAPGPVPYGEQRSSSEPDPLDTLPRYRVFGMTARILVDCARVAYGEEPDFEHSAHFGDEDLMRKLLKIGTLGMERKKGEEFVGADMRKAIKKGREKGRI